jgi:hypothetical protein
VRKRETEKGNRVPEEIQGDYQIARVAYANWPRVNFGFLGATADEVRVADATALARVEFDPWPWGFWGMTGPSTLTNPGP